MARLRRRVREAPKRAVLAAVLGAVLVGGTGVAGLLMAPSAEPAVTLALPPPAAFHELPPLLTDIRPGRRPHFATVTVVLETDADTLQVLVQRENQVIDALRALLRDYERTDLVGGGGAARLRADALVVINRILAPGEARRLLFKEMLVD